jgi:tetratricopeptide (TPR) repeat protein/mono/diheme cytochrome c family protein
VRLADRATFATLSRTALLSLALGYLGNGSFLSAQPARTITFTKDIAPIVFAHCSACHRPGGGAPFSLLTYDDVRQRADSIVAATKSRRMPPWKPEPGSGIFAGVRRLDDEQLALIQQWATTSAIEGDPRDLPTLPRWPGEWQLGSPDLVMTMPEPYVLTAKGPDVFRTFVIPIPLTEERYVTSVEFHPGTHQHAVHHANLKIDRTRGSRRLDEGEAGAGYEGGGGRGATFPDGYFLGWTPGQLPRVSPDGMAWRVEPGSDLVIELHMMPMGGDHPVQVSVGFSFTDRPPARLPYMLRLGRQDIDIPPGEQAHAVTDTFVLPVDVEALAIQPHAHNLARQISGTATLPDGTMKPLIYIKDWDFGWQDVYRYAEPLALPKGSILTMRWVYDNSAGNPRNPHRPPRRVTFGQTTASEMGDLWIQVVSRTAADRAVLDASHSSKMLAEDTAGYEKMLEVDPQDPRAHYDLALCYLELNRVADAIAHLQEAVRLEPTSPWADYELGLVLLRQRHFDEAMQHFRRAVTLKPDFSEGYNNLGAVYHLQGRRDEALRWYGEALRVRPDNIEARYNMGRVHAAQGKVDEAIAAYRHVLSVKPDDAEVHGSLGSALISRGRIDEAVAHYRRALQLRPDLPTALIDLAWVLATSQRPEIREPTEALRLARHGVEVTQQRDATAMDTLAVAYAAAGEFDAAVRTASIALDLAVAAGAQDLAALIRQRLTTWQSRR